MKLRLRLTARIVLIFVLFAAILLTVVGTCSYYGGSESLKAAAVSEMLAVEMEKEAALDRWMNERVADLVGIASSPVILENAVALTARQQPVERVEHARQRLRDQFKSNLAPDNGYLELSVLDPADGKVILSTAPTEEGKTKVGCSYFENGKNNLYLQPPYYSAETREPTLIAAMPLRSAGDSVVAVISGRLSYAAMERIVQRRTGLHQSDDSFLVNAGRYPITQPRFISEPVTLRRKIDTEAVRRCAGRSSGVILADDYRGVPVIAVYRWDAKYQLGLVVSMDQAEALAPVRAFGQSVFFIITLTLLIAAALSVALARTITRPLRILHEGMRRFGEGRVHSQLPESTNDELGLLASEFNRMARKISSEEEELRAAAEQLTWANEALQQEIAEHKKAEERATVASREAEKASKAKSEFLSRMSHELRTPLNAILGFAQLLDRQKPTDVQKNRVSHILNAGRHLLNLINEVLDIARVESGRFQLSLEPVLVEQAVDEAINLIRPLAAERKIEITRTPLLESSPSVLADRQRLKQVLLNLLSNAVKYNREAGRVIVDLGPQAQDRFRISVIDEGPGIAADKRKRLFSPFDRLGAEDSETQGTGLGLALSKRLTEAMGGTIGEGGPAMGACFWIEFPIVKGVQEQLDSSRTASTSLVKLNGDEKTLLYIEDNLSNLSLIEHLLGECAPIKLISAMQGQLGIELAARHQPDLILLDVHLPDINGAEVLARLKAKARTRDIPVVVLSADATKSQINRLMSLGAEDYLTKPLDVDCFLKVIEQHFCEPASTNGNGA